MLHVSRILVATDFSEPALRSRRRAEAFARAVGAELHVLHVSPKPRKEAMASVELHDGEAFHLFSDPDADHRLTRSDGPPLAVVPVFRQAKSAAQGILAYADEQSIDLIAMGTVGRSGIGRLVLGSTAETVVRKAKCAVVTSRSGLEPARVGGPQRILVTVDFGEGTTIAIEHARAIAAQTGSSLEVVYALEEPAAFRLFSDDAFREAMPRLVRAAEQQLTETFDAVAGPRVPAQCHVVTGDAAEEITAYALTLHADLVVMGLREASPQRTTTLGSVVERVMRTAPCPVLTIRSAGRSLVPAA
jgi:nucleotide-binding universal stress UspA family protein